MDTIKPHFRRLDHEKMYFTLCEKEKRGQKMKHRNLTNVKKGDRVRLIYMDDPYSDPGEGATGTVDCIDDIGTIHVIWDSGSRLGLITGVDRWKIIDISTEDENQGERP